MLKWILNPAPLKNALEIEGLGLPHIWRKMNCKKTVWNHNPASEQAAGDHFYSM